MRAYIFFFKYARNTRYIYTNPIPTTHNRKLNGFLYIFSILSCLRHQTGVIVAAATQWWFSIYISLHRRAALLSSRRLHNRQNGRCLATSNWFEYSLSTNPKRAHSACRVRPSAGYLPRCDSVKCYDYQV